MNSKRVSVTCSALLLFGATGDLAKRMLLPSLFALHEDGLIDTDLRIVGTARSELTDDEAEWDARAQAAPPLKSLGTGRELFAMLRHHSDPAEKGGSAILSEAGL